MEKESIFIERLVAPLNKKERLISFYKEQKFVDCTFKINGTQVRAHKLILACCSPVFEKMLYGEMAQDEIMLCDISVEEFNQVLEHMYTDDIEIHSMTNAWSLFYVANKYLLDDLIQVCLTYIRNNITMNSLSLTYEYAEMYDLLDIKKKCLDDMVNYTEGLFIGDYHMKPTTLRAILQKVDADGERLLNLLAKVINWCIVECELRNIPSSPNNIKGILDKENILEFFQVNPLEYSRCPECHYPLNEGLDEVVKKTMKLLYEVLIWCKEVYRKCTPKSIPKTCRMRNEFKIACRLDLSTNEEFVSSFSVDREMIIFGVLMNTQMEPPRFSLKYYKGIISLRICEYHTSKDIVKPTIIEDFILYSSDFYVSLKSLVVLKANRVYDLRISHKNCDMKGPSSLPCFYMSNKLTSHNKKDTISFYETTGGIIKGLSFYPA
ncbi:uncharacterized protein isoform X2 [Leptinotarsa decemlineata]|nr:kelch-like protein 41b isoform X2 [Leptinotarsa decemlineata]